MASLLRWSVRLTLAGLVVGLLAGLGGAWWAQQRFQAPARVVFGRLLDKQLWWYEPRYPSLGPLFSLARWVAADDPALVFREAADAGAPLDFLDMPIGPAGPRRDTGAEPVNPTQVVATAQALLDAIAAAQAGDVIEILPGHYVIPRPYFDAKASGTLEQPIVVRARRPGTVRLDFGASDLGFIQGFLLQGPHWTVENLELRGVCSDDMACEHAFHVVGNAHHIIIRNNVVRNFNAPVKVNLDFNTRAIPDDGLIEHNLFANDRPRATTNPVNMLDLVAASNWRVRANVYADFARSVGDGVSYGPYMKGAGHGGVIENNLIVCSLRHSGGTRIGLSLGGGGSGSDGTICADNACAFEHRHAIIRNNLVMNCSDVGLYLNNSPDALIANNSFIATRGIDVRFARSTARLVNNVIDGRILSRDGGSFVSETDLTAGWRAGLLHAVSADVYSDPRHGVFGVRDADRLVGGTRLPDPGRDFCGRPREPASPGLGAVMAGEGSCGASLKLPR